MDRSEAKIPYRMALAGGWIDQPFVSALNPDPPGSMVVVSLIPEHSFADRSGMATSSRKAAAELWNGQLPEGGRAGLVKELYEAENAGVPEPSGSQDMAGIIYPGISRLDYSADYEGGVFPLRVESSSDPEVVSWLERNISMVPVAGRPEGYNPLEEKNLDPEWIGRLGKTGRDCFDAVMAMDAGALGRSMNECMGCWEHILPCTVRHRTLTADLPGILKGYQDKYAGAMYSGCGGGYLYVVSGQDVPGGFRVKIRV